MDLKIVNKNKNGWTEERRKKQAQAIQKWRPWGNSTGPKSNKGKNASKENALKHGLHSKEGIELRHIMHQHRMLVDSILRGQDSD